MDGELSWGSAVSVVGQLSWSGYCPSCILECNGVFLISYIELLSAVAIKELKIMRWELV